MMRLRYIVRFAKRNCHAMMYTITYILLSFKSVVFILS